MNAHNSATQQKVAHKQNRGTLIALVASLIFYSSAYATEDSICPSLQRQAVAIDQAKTQFIPNQLEDTVLRV
jgi:hypothetical protein